ncbi:methyl-accepting chemotaxis protein [Pseudomonas sp. CFBP 13719]|uniref:methyl-accepting chemotaxis protein n=2 Tax=Pseudomonas TaxID=286 RepID=UPI001784F4FE|nr:methyl-accepting chemotaxis protein [Pseudomonas sp. CFBP 13719]MBD8683114.1 methyl-accepting chemotaxis protein [Pseudomonas sp. CFBP 13719]
MSNTFARYLGNLSVNLKLGIGFGVVLLLTLLIAATGWSGLTRLIERADKITSISILDDRMRDLRIAAQSFELQKGSSGADNVTRLLDQLDTDLAAAQHTLVQAEDIALVEQEIATTQAYRREFAASLASIQGREAARSQLGSTADRAVAEVNQAQAALLSQGELTAYSTLVETSRLIQQARFQVRGYTYSAKDEARQPALAAIDQAIASVAAAGASVSGEFTGRLQQAGESLRAYRAAVAQFSENQQATMQSIDKMTALGTTLLGLSDRLGDSQTARRDADTAQAKAWLAIAAALATLLGIAAAWAITAQIVGPLRQTLASVERVASGDLRQSPAITRRDELGQVQLALQRMTLNLRELVGGISEGVTQLASAAEELSAVTEQTSAGVNAQKVETDQVATAMNEMAATVQEVARNAEEASEAAVAADQQAREGDRVVSQAVGQIERLAAEVLHSSEAMNHLKQESSKIGGVLDVIKSVAQQTNLLALNAAIEAARAGEAGRGFAVVADEVRSLAQRTQQSTEEIQSLIASLQTGTHQVSSALDSSRAMTDSSVQLARRAGESLSDITRTVSTIQAMNQQIAAAAEQQSVVAEEINRSVLNVRDVSEQTSAASEETAASSIELARLGTHLQGLVGQFKV